jgi:hypothetical protein
MGSDPSIVTNVTYFPEQKEGRLVSAIWLSVRIMQGMSGSVRYYDTECGIQGCHPMREIEGGPAAWSKLSASFVLIRIV